MNIRLFRISVNLTQRELAKIANVTQANISQWENGASTPPVRILEILKERYPKIKPEKFFSLPEASKNFFLDNHDIKIQEFQETIGHQKKEIDQYQNLTIELRKEIDRLKDQVDVFTMLVRKELMT